MAPHQLQRLCVQEPVPLQTFGLNMMVPSIPAEPRREVTSVTATVMPDLQDEPRREVTPVTARVMPNLPDEPRREVTTATAREPANEWRGVTTVTAREPASNREPQEDQPPAVQEGE